MREYSIGDKVFFPEKNGPVLATVIGVIEKAPALKVQLENTIAYCAPRYVLPCCDICWRLANGN